MLLFLRSSLIRPPTLLTVSFDRDWREGGREGGRKGVCMRLKARVS